MKTNNLTFLQADKAMRSSREVRRPNWATEHHIYIGLVGVGKNVPAYIDEDGLEYILAPEDIRAKDWMVVKYGSDWML